MVLKSTLILCWLTCIWHTGNGQTDKQESPTMDNKQFTVSGKVVFCNTAEAVSTAAVQLLMGGKEVSETWTEPDGTYELSWISPGDYTLRFTKEESTVEVKAEVKADLTNRDACLKKSPPQKPSIDPAQASSDIAGGVVQIYICDPGPELPIADLDKITSKYGFRYTVKGGCPPSEEDGIAFEQYNQIVKAHLDKINPPGWTESLGLELDALISKVPQDKSGEEYFIQ